MSARIAIEALFERLGHSGMDMVSANAHPASGSMSDEEGQVSLGPLTIFFPDVSCDTFWFMEDLVDVLGVESNSEARAALKAALKGRRAVHLEHEADNVVAKLDHRPPPGLFDIAQHQGPKGPVVIGGANAAVDLG